MARRVKTLLAVAVLAILCASCKVDMKVAVVMKADGSGTITVTATADADVVKQAPNLAADLKLDDIKANGWTVQGPAATPDGGLQIVLIHAFQTPEEATTIMAGINGAGGPLVGTQLSRVRAKGTTTFTLNGSLHLTDGLNAFADNQLLTAVGGTPYIAQIQDSGVAPAAAVSVALTASLPGHVQTSTAAKGGGLSWTTPTDGSTQVVTAISEIHDAKNVWAKPLAKGALIAFWAWISLSVLFIAYVLFARRRRYRQRALR